MFPVLLFPQFNPVLVHLGPFSIRWYALAYIAGIVLGWRLLRRKVVATPPVATVLHADDFVTWATLGIVLGGRAGYVLFYNLAYYRIHPLKAFALWDGGMSFHGGMIGVIVANLIFCRRNRLSILGFADRLAVCVPIGLFFGRIANFINGELWGRPAPASLPWAMIFPQSATFGPAVPRHPSQLYQALMEGVVLFAVMLALSSRADLRRRPGLLTGVFLAGYAVARVIGEMFRQPDAQLGFLWLGATMGQVLCLPMLVAGLWLIARALGRPALRHD